MLSKMQRFEGWQNACRDGVPSVWSQHAEAMPFVGKSNFKNVHRELCSQPHGIESHRRLDTSPLVVPQVAAVAARNQYARKQTSGLLWTVVALPGPSKAGNLAACQLCNSMLQCL
jgi:hypothetical protein